MHHLRLVPAGPRRHFTFEARFVLPAPEAPPAPTPSHLPPFHAMFSEVEREAKAGERPEWFIPLRLLVEDDPTDAVVPLVTPFLAEASVREAFATWKDAEPVSRACLGLTACRQHGDVGEGAEPGVSVILEGGSADVCHS